MRSFIAATAVAASTMLGTPGTGLKADDTGGSRNGLVEDTWKIILPFQEVEGVLGKQVKSSAGQPIGRIVQILVDKAGRVQGAVIDFGGFMGVGTRKIVVQWAALHFAPGEDNGLVTLDLTPDQVKAAPEYKPGKPVVALGALTPLPEL
jgi:hypothetical protein